MFGALALAADRLGLRSQPASKNSEDGGKVSSSCDTAYSPDTFDKFSAESLAELDVKDGAPPLPEQGVPEHPEMLPSTCAKIGRDGRPSQDSARARLEPAGMSSSAFEQRHSGATEPSRRSSSTFDRRGSSCGADPRRSSCATPHGRGSTGSAHSEQSSGRSSFAMEQDANYAAQSSMDSSIRPSMETFGHATPAKVERAGPVPDPLSGQQLEAMCGQLGVPHAMRGRFLHLAALAPNLPVPMQALRHLWELGDVMDAEATAALFEQLGIMRVACLADGSAWGLVQPHHLSRLQTACPSAPPVHAGLLGRYACGSASLAEVPDDGYFLQAVGHHCMAAQRAELLEGLLSRPEWLHHKLRAYGVAAIVSDFRRYLGASDANPDVKLLLEAFQMALAAWNQRPEAAMLRAQMIGRLLAAARTPFLASWLAAQQEIAVGALNAVMQLHQRATAAAVKTGAAKQGRAGPIACLVPATPSLTQAGGLQRMLLKGHSAPLTALLLTPTGVDLLTGAEDGSLRLWDMEVGDCVMQLAGHSAAINALATPSSGAPLVSASADGTARLWDLQQGNCCVVLVGHSAAVEDVAVDPQGRFCITASADSTARVWSLESGVCVHVLRGHGSTSLTGAVHAVALTPDSRSAVTASNDMTARLWDLTNGKCSHVLEGHTASVADVKVSANGKMAVTASHDGTARVWQLLDGNCLHVLEGHTGRLNALVLVDGNSAVTASDDSTARVWNLVDGTCRHVLEGHGGFVTGVAIAADGAKTITTSGDTLAMVWDLATGACLEVLQGHAGTVSAAVLTRKSRFGVTASRDGTARVWNLLADASHAVRSHASRVICLALSPDGQHVASIGDDAAAFVWRVADGKCAANLQGHLVSLRYGCFLGNSRYLITASGDRQVNSWDVTADAPQQPSIIMDAAPGSRLKAFAASVDGRRAVLALFDSSVNVIDLATGATERVLQKRGQRDADAHAGGINAVYLTKDATKALTVSKDYTARVWDVATGSSIRLAGHEDNVSAAAVSACGRKAVTISDDGTARLWDIVRGMCCRVMRLGALPTVVEMAPDGRSCVILTVDHCGYVWNLEGGACVSRLTGHTDDVTAAALSADGSEIVTCSVDNTLRLWHAASGQQKALFVSDTGLTCCAFSEASGKVVLMAGADNGSVHFLPL